MGQPAARTGDNHVCPMQIPGTPPIPHVGGPVGPAATKTLIGGVPAARIGDQCICTGMGGAPVDPVAKGEPSVLIEGKPAARLGDMTGHGGVIGAGCPTVLIGFGGGPFASIDDAARAALTAANLLSIHDNLEYGGVIYRGPDGNYYYTGPSQGSPTGFNPSATPAPPGTTQVGDYHTHGDYSIVDPSGNIVRTSNPAMDDFNSDNFSAQDKVGIAADGAGVPGYTGYLGTPSGTFRRYDPATNSDTVL